jgi:hypothetical protein
MQRSDNESFGLKADGKIGGFINLGAGGKVELLSDTTISFRSADPQDAAAFAYKAGRLALEDSRWAFYPEEVLLSAGNKEEKIAYIPARGVVLRAEMSDTRGGR